MARKHLEQRRTLDGEKLLPQNVEAEAGVLGSLLINPDAIVEVADTLRPDDFYIEAHRLIYQAALDLYTRKVPVDLITLTDELARRGALDEIGGASSVSSLANQVPTSWNVKPYAQIVKRCSRNRKMLDAAGDIANAAYNDPDDVHGFVEYATNRLRDANEDDANDDNDESAEGVDLTRRPFPTEALPLPFQLLVRHAAKAVGCAPDLVGAPLLAALSTAIGATCVLQVKSGYEVSPILWLATVARPGEGKTPAMNKATREIYNRQNVLKKEYDDEHKEWEDMEVDEGEKRGPEPTLKQVFVQDITPEALFAVLAHNARGVLLSRDELAGWVRSMDQYKAGKGAERQHWMSMWSAEPVMVNRRTRQEPTYLTRPLVSVVGSIQPDMLGELSDERGREEGFIHRILFAYPEPRKLGKWSTDVVSEDIHAEVGDAFDRLWKFQDATGGLEAKIPAPNVATFTQEGAHAWEAWVNEHRAEQNAPDFTEALRGPWQKLESYAARFALILHLARWACGDDVEPLRVDAHSMLCAEKLIAYFKSHAQAIYARLYTPPEEMQFAELAAWIRKQPGQSASVRDVQRAKVAKLSKSTEIKWFFAEMAERGQGDVIESPGKRGRKSVRFTMKQKNVPLSTIDNSGSAQAGTAA